MEDNNFGVIMKKNTFAKMIDHTLLKANAKVEDIEKLCSEAKSMVFTRCVLIHFGSHTVTPNYTFLQLKFAQLLTSL